MKNTKRPASFIPCGARQGRAGISISARCCVIIGSSSSEEGDVNENGKTLIGLDWQNNNSARGSRFFVHFFDVTTRLRRENAQFYVRTEDENTTQ